MQKGQASCLPSGAAGARRVALRATAVPSDAALGAQLLEVRIEVLRLQALLQLGLHLLVRRDLGIADVVDADHVPAELRLHRLRG